MATRHGLMVAAAALALSGAALAAGDARILDSGGRTLTVGNWIVPSSGTDGLKVPDSRRLGWELRDGKTLVLSGAVPNTFDLNSEYSPILSRNPVSGEILLAWSRQNQSGLRDIVLMPFLDSTWLPARMTVAAHAAMTSQVDPYLLHDGAGRAYLAWRDLDWQRRILMNVYDVNGHLISEQVLSTGVTSPGPPALGLDQRGDVVAAFFGRDEESGESRVFIASTPDGSGGLIHVPNPIVELAVTASTPTPSLGGAPTTGSLTAPHVSVLSDTSTVWWTREEPDGRSVLEHVTQVDGSWAQSRLGRIVLSEDSADPLREALELLEVRLRRPTAPFDPEVTSTTRSTREAATRR